MDGEFVKMVGNCHRINQELNDFIHENNLSMGEMIAMACDLLRSVIYRHVKMSPNNIDLWERNLRNLSTEIICAAVEDVEKERNKHAI